MCSTCVFAERCGWWAPGGCVFYEPAEREENRSSGVNGEKAHGVTLAVVNLAQSYPPIEA